MPFPSKEIEEAYRAVPPLAQGCFGDDPGFYAAYEPLQALTVKLEGRLDAETMEDIRELLRLLRAAREYERRHYFTEGWRMASK